MELQVEVRGVEELARSFQGLQQDLDAELFGVMRDLAQQGVVVAQAHAPSFTGVLRKGIKVRSSRKRGLYVSVHAGAPHSWLVEHGRRPGKMPSVDPAHASNPKSAQRLADWAKAHNINPFILARAIARRGTRGHPYMAAARAAIAPAFEPTVRAAVDRVLAKYNAS